MGPQHAGVYKSVIANKLGKAACYAHLYVTGEAGTARPLAYPGGWVKQGLLHQFPSFNPLGSHLALPLPLWL